MGMVAGGINCAAREIFFTIPANKNPKFNYELPKMKNLKKTETSISYDYVFHTLEQVHEEKDLIIIIDDNLNFRKHMSGKISKVNSILFLI